MESKIKRFHDQLRNDLQVQFPSDAELKEKKAIFDKASERQRERNEILLDQLEETDPHYASFIGPKGPLPTESRHPAVSVAPPKYEVGSRSELPNKTLGETPGGETPTSDFEIWKRQIREVNRCIDNIGEDQISIETKIMRIETFKARYETDF